MDSLIKSLVDIDKKASEIVESASIQVENQHAGIDLVKKQMDDDYILRAEKHKQNLKQSLEKDFEIFCEEEKVAYENMVAGLENMYNRNKRKWIDEISGNLINNL